MERKYLIWKLKVSSVTDVGYCYYANANRIVEDPRKKTEVVNKEKHKMKDTIRKFMTDAWCKAANSFEMVVRSGRGC